MLLFIQYRCSSIALFIRWCWKIPLKQPSTSTKLTIQTLPDPKSFVRHIWKCLVWRFPNSNSRCEKSWLSWILVASIFFWTLHWISLNLGLMQVVMLGDISTGKTSLVYRFTQGYYRDDGHPPTTGAVFSVKKIQTIGGVTCNVQIWDTAGVPERTKFAHLYYKTADAAIICYDVGNSQSYDVLCIWLEELRRHMSGRFKLRDIFNSSVCLIDSHNTACFLYKNREKSCCSDCCYQSRFNCRRWINQYESKAY